MTKPAALGRAAAKRHARAVLLIGAISLAALIGWSQPASARWLHVARSRSSTEPYFACARQGSRPHCEVIEDPTNGLQVSGPVHAGAITAGPALEVSPATYGSGMDGGYSPQNLQDAYALPSSTAGSGQTVGIVDAYDDPDAEADMNTYRSHYGLAECTSANGCFHKLSQTGSSKSLPKGNEEWGTEISLDLDMVSATCPNCHILLVEATEATPGDLAAAEDEAVALGATEISNSYTSAAASEPSEIVAAYDHPGIPITAAAGDEGYAAGVQSPAANPHVIAVGGTTLTPESNARGWTESVWDHSAHSGTGSGCSLEPKPAWQKDTGCAYRTLNDVAAVADQNTPVSVYDSYGAAGWRLLAGTSASTAIVAGAMALSDTYTKSLEGAKALYLEAQLRPESLFEVLAGSNGSCGNYLCEAGQGYNGPTGLGSLNGPPEVPAPTAVTDAASGVGRTSATLNASVDPYGAEASECRFEFGTTPSYGSSMPCSGAVGSGTSAVAVSAALTGLKAQTAYHYRVAFSYRSGETQSSDGSFATGGMTPGAATEAASGISQTSATLNATVNPNGEALTGCEFQYGPSDAYGSSAPCGSTPGAGSAPVAASATIHGLTAGHVYHYRIVASSLGGTGYGADEEVELLPEPPLASTGAAAEVGERWATVGASVNAEGAPLTRCEFQYGPAGASSFGQSAPCGSTPGAHEGTVAVSARLTELSGQTIYDYRVVAANAGGTTYGATETVTTVPSPAQLVTPPVAPPLTPTSPPPGRIELADSTLLVSSSGTLGVPLRCEPSQASCTGAISLRSVAASRASTKGGAGQAVALASGTFAVLGGRVANVKLRISAAARALLTHTRSVHARVTITVNLASSGTKLTQSLVTLRLRRTLPSPSA